MVIYNHRKGKETRKREIKMFDLNTIIRMNEEATKKQATKKERNEQASGNIHKLDELTNSELRIVIEKNPTIISKVRDLVATEHMNIIKDVINDFSNCVEIKFVNHDPIIKIKNLNDFIRTAYSVQYDHLEYSNEIQTAYDIVRQNTIEIDDFMLLLKCAEFVVNKLAEYLNSLHSASDNKELIFYEFVYYVRATLEYDRYLVDNDYKVYKMC